VLSIFGTLAAFERELIRERTVAGLQAARDRGRVLGRPTVVTPTKLAAALSLLATGATVTDAAAAVGGFTTDSVPAPPGRGDGLPIVACQAGLSVTSSRTSASRSPCGDDRRPGASPVCGLVRTPASPCRYRTTAGRPAECARRGACLTVHGHADRPPSAPRWPHAPRRRRHG